MVAPVVEDDWPATRIVALPSPTPTPKRGPPGPCAVNACARVSARQTTAILVIIAERLATIGCLGPAIATQGCNNGSRRETEARAVYGCPATLIGTGLEVVVPLPSAPLALDPQQ